jgi:hypothetical protein
LGTLLRRACASPAKSLSPKKNGEVNPAAPLSNSASAHSEDRA